MRRDFPRAIVFIFFIILPSTVTADCIEYENYVRWIGQNNTIGPGLYEKDITLSGTVAYVAAGQFPPHCRYFESIDPSTHGER